MSACLIGEEDQHRNRGIERLFARTFVAFYLATFKLTGNQVGRQTLVTFGCAVGPGEGESPTAAAGSKTQEIYRLKEKED
jgi:hypothetical protein